VWPCRTDWGETGPGSDPGSGSGPGSGLAG